MLLRDVDLNLLVAFEAMADAGSVSRAAERLGIRQPAMSAALARLRTLFGDPLFVRAGGGMRPTAKAERLAPRIAEALQRVRGALADESVFSPPETDQHFRIASTDYTTAVILPALIERLRRDAPGASLSVIGYDKGDIPALVANGEIDIALGTFATPPERAVRRALCSEQFVGLARREHPALEGGMMSLEAYIAAAHALVSVRRDRFGAIDRVLAQSGVTRRIALVIPYMLALPPILSRTDLIAAVPSRVAARLEGDRLVRFGLPIACPTWNIEMLWNPAARRDPAAAWLRRAIVDAAAAA